jgi:hypothetical protein
MSRFSAHEVLAAIWRCVTNKSRHKQTKKQITRKRNIIPPTTLENLHDIVRKKDFSSSPIGTHRVRIHGWRNSGRARGVQAQRSPPHTLLEEENNISNRGACIARCTLLLNMEEEKLECQRGPNRARGKFHLPQNVIEVFKRSRGDTIPEIVHAELLKARP